MHSCIFEFSDEKGHKSEVSISNLHFQSDRRFIDYIQEDHYRGDRFDAIMECLKERLPTFCRMDGRELKCVGDTRDWVIDFFGNFYTKALDKLLNEEINGFYGFSYIMSHPSEVTLNFYSLFYYDGVLMNYLEFFNRVARMPEGKSIYLTHLHDFHE